MKSLCLFTESFPFGDIDIFLHDEIKFLSKKSEHIYIFPLNYTGKQNFDLPNNASVIKFNFYSPFNRIKLLIFNFPFILSIYVYELKKSNHTLKYLSDFFNNLNFLLQKINCAKELKNCFFINEIESKNTIFYSYWFKNWTSILCILKKQNEIYKLVTRAHGGDLYEERRRQFGNYFPFRSFMINQLNYVFPISEFGTEYLKDIYPKQVNKILTFRLGVFDRGINTINENFTIVSCSSLIPLKRIHLIVEILKYLKFKVMWFHIGGGDEYGKIINLVNQLPDNITVEFLGDLRLEDVYQFYQSHNVNVFINVSETEGIPVSIMEAISFGIPVIATNVGGTSEVVNNKIGYLIDKNFDCKEIAEKITCLYDNRNLQVELSKNARQFWQMNFNAENNYNAFTQFLVTL